MKIFGAGLSRTGTTSLTKALKILGYRAIQFDVGFVRLLKQAGRTGEFDFTRYDEIDALFDTPTAVFYQEFLDQYPDMKVILSVRDEDAWWSSINTHLQALQISGPNDHRTGWKWPATTWYSRITSFGWPTANEYVYRQRYRAHNKAVKAFVPADQLLVLDVTAGHCWEPLCEFLGRSVPDTPFPWLQGGQGK